MVSKAAIVILIALSLFVVIASRQGGEVHADSYAPVVDFDLDKPIYRPGDQVTVTINSPLVDGAFLVLDVIEGNSDRRIFHASRIMQVPEGKEVIANYGRDVGSSPSPITINFSLPNALGVNYYQMNIAVYFLDQKYSNYVPTYTGSAILFTNEDARRIFVTDVAIDTVREYRPGEGIPVSFQVKDGHGRNVNFARPNIMMCDGSKSFCVSMMVESLTDTYSVNFGIPKQTPVGIYTMTISSGVYPSDSAYAFTAQPSTIDGIVVKGSPVTSEPMEIAQYFDYNETADVPAQFIRDGRLTYGQNLILSSSQQRLFSYGNEQIEVPLEDVTVQFQISDPNGEIVFNETRVVDQNGRIDNLVFPITDNLKRGTYELFHRPSKNGIDFHSGAERWTFHVTNMQKLNVTVPYSSQQEQSTLYFDSRDLDVTNYSYDNVNKTFSFDVKHNHLYKHKHYAPLYNNDGFAFIGIPKHLLADPFEVRMNDNRVVDFTLLEQYYYFAAEWNQTLVNPFLVGWEPERPDGNSHTLITVGPIYEDGTITTKLLGANDPNRTDRPVRSEFRNIIGIESAGFWGSSGEQVDVTEVGGYTTLSAYVKNPYEVDIPYVAVAEVRNYDGITEFLAIANDTVTAYSPSGEGNTQVWIPWQPKEAGQYQMRLFLLSNLEDKPQILTRVYSAEITVNPRPEPETPPVPDVAKTINIGKSKEITLTSYDRDRNGESARVIITLDNVTTHTGDIEYVLHRQGFMTLVLNYSVENIDNYAFYAQPDFEAIADGDTYPYQSISGALGSALLPNEKRDSFVVIQVIEGATEVTFDIKDTYTRKTVWKVTVDVSE
jgi:hypothetical protein